MEAVVGAALGREALAAGEEEAAEVAAQAQEEVAAEAELVQLEHRLPLPGRRRPRTLSPPGHLTPPPPPPLLMLLLRMSVRCRLRSRPLLRRRQRWLGGR